MGRAQYSRRRYSRGRYYGQYPEYVSKKSHLSKKMGYVWKEIVHQDFFSLSSTQFLLIYIMALFLLACGSVESSSPSGSGEQAQVIDGDTIRLLDSGRTVRLAGIDAPESGQTCKLGSKTIRCGIESKQFLRNLIDGQGVRCDQNGIDSYNRIIGTCFVDELELNAHMVKQGMAVAFLKYEDTYATEEQLAKSNSVGIWQYDFVRPQQFRSDGWNSAKNDTIPDPTCPIKGNINSKGVKIYHMPYNRDYKKTRINTAKGEKWFCDENQALAAGWRAVK